jgi:hypothetical protein
LSHSAGLKKGEDKSGVEAKSGADMEVRMHGVEEKLEVMGKMLQNVCKFIGSSSSPRAAPVSEVNPAGQVQVTASQEETVSTASTAWGSSTLVKPTQPPCFRSILKEEHLEAQKEVERAMRRRRNVILYKVKELESDSWSRRQEHDGKVIKKLMDALNFSPEIVDFHRLGHRYASSGSYKDVMSVQKERPLLVTLKDEDDRQKILQSLNKLGDADSSLKKIRISPDMSLQERDEVRTLVQKAKNLNAKEEGDSWHIVRGRRIIKVKRWKKKSPAPTVSQVDDPQEGKEEEEDKEVTAVSQEGEANKEM